MVYKFLCNASLVFRLGWILSQYCPMYFIFHWKLYFPNIFIVVKEKCIYFYFRVVVRLGSTVPFSQELNELQEEVKPLWKMPSCPRDFKRTSVEILFREAEFRLDWCSFRLVSRLTRGATHEILFAVINVVCPRGIFGMKIDCLFCYLWYSLVSFVFDKIIQTQLRMNYTLRKKYS